MRVSKSPIRIAAIYGVREPDAALYGSESDAGTQILKDNFVRRKQVDQRLPSEAVHADNAGTHDGMAYQFAARSRSETRLTQLA